MLKSFKLLITVLIATASSLGAVAQTETYKDVLLDGKPAKLNLVTGEVTLVDSKTTQLKSTKKGEATSTSDKTEIKANLITDTPKTPKTNKIPEKIVENSTIETPKSPETNLTNKIEKATTLVYETSQPTIEDVNNSDFHLVKKGETLYALSKRYTVSLADLKRANNLETTLIKTGQTLRVKNFENLSVADVWTVSKGDTLYNISKRTNTTVEVLKALNGLQSNLIKIGQVLRLK